MILAFRHFDGPNRTDGITIATADTAFPNIKSSLPFGDALNWTIYGTRTTLNTSVIDMKF